MKNILRSLAATFAFFSLTAQTSSTNWTTSYKIQKVFIENRGQFDNLNNLKDSKILFATENYSDQILLSKNGLTYRFEERVQPSKEERGEKEEEMEREIKR